MSDLSTSDPAPGRPAWGSPAPGWYDDPWRVAELRYWSGADWTPEVARRVRPPRPPHPTMPISVALGTLAVTSVALIVSRFLLDALSVFDLPIAVYVVIGGVLGYGPIVLWCWWAAERWAHTSLRAAAGFYFRWSDTGWGPIVWLCCFGTQIAIGTIIVVFDVPFTSNTESLDSGPVDRGYVIAVLVLAVVAAPIVEEIAFRGFVLRGLLGRFPAVPAIAIQAVLFGSAHFDPTRGAGNIGLIMILSGVGAVLGGAAYLFRRLGASVLAHGILNAIALTVALSGWGSDL